MSFLRNSSHRRFNPLTRDWVLVSPQRTNRPWQGQTKRQVETAVPAYDANCYLCPGNPRANGERNPAYTSVFAFDNDFAALAAGRANRTKSNEGGLLVARRRSRRLPSDLLLAAP